MKGQYGCEKHSGDWQYWKQNRMWCLGCERDALRHCLKVLKSRHMTKPGISTLVKETEERAGI